MYTINPPSAGIRWIKEGIALYAKTPWLWLAFSSLNTVLFYCILVSGLLIGGMAGILGSLTLFALVGLWITVTSIRLAQMADAGLRPKLKRWASILDRKARRQLLLFYLFSLAATGIVIALVVGLCTLSYFAFGLDRLMVTLPGMTQPAPLTDAVGSFATVGTFIIITLIALCCIAITMAFWFAPALVTLANMGFGSSLWLSFKGFLMNSLSISIYTMGLGFIYLLLLMVTIPGGAFIYLGTLLSFLISPLLFTTHYFVFRDIFGQQVVPEMQK